VTTTARRKARAGPNGDSTATSPETLKDEMVAHLRQDREKLLREWRQAVTADGGLWIGTTAAEQESESARVYDACVDCLDRLSYQGAEDFAGRMARRAVGEAITSEAMLGGMLALRDVYWRGLLTHYLEEPDRLDEVLKVFESPVNNILIIVALAFSAERERVISQQQAAIEDLSTPVLRLRDRLLLLPLIGLIDSDRARQVTDGLLKAIRDFRAQVVVMDITGVAAVDSKVANHLIQTVDAARLLGATVVVTGVSPDIAQTIVTVGVDLSQVRTVGDLQGGIDLADRLLGYRVVVLGERGDAPVAPTTLA
jgi:rsbT co-antagonist protein RsbR